MDPKHIARALAAMYLAERGGKVTVAKSLLLDSAKQELHFIIRENDVIITL